MLKKVLLALGFYLIGGIHTMIFGIFQIPENFLLGHSSHELNFICKIVFYGFAITTSLSHQYLARLFGLRKTFYLGLICNLAGLTLLMINRLVVGQGLVFLVFLDMVLFGVALTSVINCLITYVILQYKKKVGMGITALFTVFDAGLMSAPILLQTLEQKDMSILIYPILMVLMGVSLWFTHAYFFTSEFSSRQETLRKGSLLWKELHYRLALFVVAIIAYGLTETTFALWGFTLVKNLLEAVTANKIVSIFWTCMIVGQSFLMISFYFFSIRKLFYLYVLAILFASYYFPFQTELVGFTHMIIVAGLGCSGMFPILLSMLEREILFLVQETHLLPYIETGVSVMIAGYFIGVGSIDLIVERIGDQPLAPISSFFHLISFAIVLVGLIAIYLNLTRPKKVA